MAKTHTTTVQAILALTVIGVLSSFAFVTTVFAAGIVPSDVVALANSARSKAGLAPLTENAALSLAAKNKANDMLKHDYFAHTSPTGVAPWYWIKDAGYAYQAAGENLAINYTDARDQHEAWMKSETHRANIMNTRYREIGVAVVSGKINGKESIVTVEYFGTPVVVVAEKTAPIPVAPVSAPADIKGDAIEETPSLAPLAPTPLIIPVVVSEEDRIITLLALVWILFMTILAPTLILGRAIHFLLKAKDEGTVSVPLLPMIHIDLHKNAH